MMRALADANLPAELTWLREPPPEPADATWLAGAAVVVAASLAMAVVGLARRDRARHGPAFRWLARELGLGAAERRLLKEAAAAVQVPPASLLVSRGCFESAIGAAPLPPGGAQRAAAIRRRVFG